MGIQSCKNSPAYRKFGENSLTRSSSVDVLSFSRQIWIDQLVHMSLVAQDEIVNVSPAITYLKKIY